MEERYYVITVEGQDNASAFDGTTLCPTVGWERMAAGGTHQEHSKYNRLISSTPVGLFTPEVLGRGTDRGAASLVRVWCNGDIEPGDVWSTKGNRSAGEGEPTDVQRELPSALSTNPADAPPKELAPTDNLSVTCRAIRGGTITIVVVDMSEEEYLAWARLRWLASNAGVPRLSSEEVTLTEAGSIPTPTRDLTFVHINAELNEVFVLPDPGLMSMEQALFIDNVGPNDVRLHGAPGSTVNGKAGGALWQELPSGQATFVRKVGDNAHVGTSTN